MESVRNEIRKIAKELLSEKKVDLLIGYEKATVPLKNRPCFIYTEDVNDENIDEVVNKLEWDSFCTNNLAAFLQKHFENVPNRRKKREEPYPTIGVVVKGCDLRSIVALIKERQVIRENLVLIGVPCQGMIDRRKVEEEAGEEIAEYSETDDGTLTVKGKSGKEYSFQKGDVMQLACVECRFPMPENTDYMVEGEAKQAGDGGYARIAEFEKLPHEERWAYFEKELSKCIRCNACRQACPTCWCKECFAEHTDLKWIGVGNELSDAMVFQITRIFHQAGRCVECDACYNACPMGIDLRTYTKKMVKDVEEVFNYLPNFDTETLPPLATYSEQDKDFFITDPEKK
jgi:formate dehydrogenase (coenzyme F420) beta subunit